MAINKEYSTPLYQQLVDSVKAQIRDGILKEDDRLGSEQDISREYNVSRITVHKAFEILADEGYVTKRQGIGTFVSARKLNNFNEGQMRGFTEMCIKDGKVPSSELISAGWVSNLPSISHHLHVPEEEPILRVLRVRKCDGVPVMVEDGYFPKRFSYLMSEDLCGSTFEIFRRHGTKPSHFSKIMDICYATKFEAQKLEVRERQALLLQKDMAFDQNGDAIHYTKLVINPERYKLTIIM